jgi:hypothetical protein
MSWIFIANNPGSWFMHCHIELHLEAGLALVFEQRSGIPDPPSPQFFATFPTSCNAIASGSSAASSTSHSDWPSEGGPIAFIVLFCFFVTLTAILAAILAASRRSEASVTRK